MYTFDTNVIIYYLKDDSSAVSLVKSVLERNAPVYVSAVTEVELFGFSGLSVAEARHIEAILNTVSVIPLDSRIARLAGFLRRQNRLNVADSVIAATALFTGTTLATRNVHDFKKVAGLSLLKI
jgi:toxin FitB